LENPLSDHCGQARESGFCREVDGHLEIDSGGIRFHGKCDVETCKESWIGSLCRKVRLSDAEREEVIQWADGIHKAFEEDQGCAFLHIGEAINAYRAAGAQEKLISLGRLLLKRGWLKQGLRAYKIAGSTPTKIELISCGDAILEKALNDIPKGNCLLYPVNHALAAYKLAGTLPIERFVAIGDALVKKYNLLAKCPPCDRPWQSAVKAYFVAIRTLTKGT